MATATGAVTALDEMATDGAFVRTAAGFRDHIKQGSSEFPPEAGRYHLYVSPLWCRMLTGARWPGGSP
jgi:glutathionyl-hydroquinone reductase